MRSIGFTSALPPGLLAGTPAVPVGLTATLTLNGALIALAGLVV
jgi:hypothetical protein